MLSFKLEVGGLDADETSVNGEVKRLLTKTIERFRLSSTQQPRFEEGRHRNIQWSRLQFTSYGFQSKVSLHGRISNVIGYCFTCTYMEPTNVHVTASKIY